MVKGAADLSSKDPQSSGQVFDEALRVAERLNDRFWIGRISGELGITAFLRGDTAKAVELNARAFAIAKSLNDVQGEVRAKSLDGVGLLEQQRFDDALIRFNEALNFARLEPDVRFPLMAYMGKSEALQAQGNQRESDALLDKLSSTLRLRTCRSTKRTCCLNSPDARSNRSDRGCPVASSASCGGFKECWDAQAVCTGSALDHAALHGCGRFPKRRIVHKRMHNGEQKTC